MACLLLACGSGAQAQVGSGLTLESPILPEAMGSPVVTPAAPSMVNSDFSGNMTQANFVGCTGCGSIGCNGCDDLGPGYQCPPGVGLWIRADYLIWYEKNMDTIPLATTSSGFPAGDPDDLLDLDASETSVLFGGRSLNSNPLEGWRLEVGTWLDAGATYGIFGRYYEVGDRRHSFRSSSDQIEFLGIPYFDFDSDQENAFELVVPNERNGLLDIQFDGGFRSWEVLFRRLAETGSNYRMDWVYGYRNTRLFDSLAINAGKVFLVEQDSTLEGTRITTRDAFDVKNQFHGIDLGITGHSHEGCWSLDFLLKVGLGVMDQEITIDGEEVNRGPQSNDPFVLVGGFFSQETNIGKHDTSDFGVIPEFDLNLGYALTPHIDFTIGYTFIYLNSVVRAGTAIDRVIDQGVLVDLDPVNSNRPTVNFDDTSYYIHGLNIGMTGRF